MGFLDDLFEGFGRRGGHGHGRGRFGGHDDHGRRYDDDHDDHGYRRYDDDHGRRYDRDEYYRQPGYDPQAVQRVLVCPSCGSDNPVKAKFCMECGQPLRPAGAARLTPSEPPSPER